MKKEKEMSDEVRLALAEQEKRIAEKEDSQEPSIPESENIDRLEAAHVMVKTVLEPSNRRSTTLLSEDTILRFAWAEYANEYSDDDGVPLVIDRYEERARSRISSDENKPFIGLMVDMVGRTLMQGNPERGIIDRITGRRR